MILVDTDHFSVVTDARHSLHGQLISRLSQADDQVAVPVVAVEEQLRAWLAQIHRVRDMYRQVSPYARLVRLIAVLAEWEIAGWDAAAAEKFMDLRRARIRIGTQDLKIAAIALANNALLLSANLRDFGKVPGLAVRDWLYG